MIHILSWTTKTHQKTPSMPLNSKLTKIQGLFKEKWNSRTFQDCASPEALSLERRAPPPPPE